MYTVYSYSGADIAEFRRTYGELVRREYYDGELDLDAAPRFEITVQKALSDPISMLRVCTASPISFRRSLDNIRSNKVGLWVLWFVRRGAIRFTRSRGTCDVKAGECVIVDSGVPFHARTLETAEGNYFDAVQVIVPGPFFHSHLAVAQEYDKSFKVGTDNHQIATRLLDILFGEGDHLSKNTAAPLAAAFLETISDQISSFTDRTKPQSLISKRLADIEAYITRHLTDPNLSYDEVATKCGISPRYLCYLLKANKTSFSALLWGQRLTSAHKWLGSKPMQQFPIFQIGLMAGFKSAAHFSRMFKSAYGYSPKECRSRALSAEASGDGRSLPGDTTDWEPSRESIETGAAQSTIAHAA